MTLILLTLIQLCFIPFVLTAKTGRSRKVLAVTLILIVPIAGPLLALITVRSRGGRIIPLDQLDPSIAQRGAYAQMRRSADLSASLEKLMSTNSEERMGALVKLSAAADARAVAQLRWAIEHGVREVVLDAALTLEELGLRAEKRQEAALKALQASPSFATAFAAAEACAHGVLTGLADDASIPALANQARELYLQALQLDPTRAAEVEEPLARLELAAARPGEALAILERLMGRQEQGGAIAQRLRQLRDQAAFAARRFDLLSFRSLPLQPRVTLF
jgi:hypothetical protein